MLHIDFYCFIVTAAAAAEHRVHEMQLIVDGNQVIFVTAILLSIRESMLISYFACKLIFKESMCVSLHYFTLPLLFKHASALIQKYRSLFSCKKKLTNEQIHT